MAVGKNKRMSKGKKGSKKKVGDAFLKKEWYELRAPSLFQQRNFGRTLVSKSAGTKLAADSLRGRVYECNLGDLNMDEDQVYRKVRLLCEAVDGNRCLTDFAGLSITRDKLGSLVRKWHSLVEAHADVQTADGYTLRIFCIAQTERRPNQVKSTCYARSSQIRMIRKKMISVISAEASKCALKDLVKKFIPESIGKAIENACKGIFPLQNVLLRKVKVVKKPKFDLTRLMELHGDSGEDAGKKVETEAAEAQNTLTAEVKASS